MHHADGRNGFTLLEVLLASLLLAAGVGALAGSATVTVGMMTRARAWGSAVRAATTQLESLRAAAAAAPGGCAQLADGADSLSDGTAWSWRISPAGDRREVSLAVAALIPAGRVVDTLSSSLWCR